MLDYQGDFNIRGAAASEPATLRYWQIGRLKRCRAMP
jgi:hypothetical protein